MTMNLKSRQKGFTLIELLIVVAIIGIIAAILIPNFLDALHKGRQKRTMGDMREFGTAYAAYLTDVGGAGAAGGATQVSFAWTDIAPTAANCNETTSVQDVIDALAPDYTRLVPELDGWGNDLVYSICLNNPPRAFYMGIWSPGRDDLPAAPGTIDPLLFDPTDYDQDLAFVDGTFVRAPRGFQAQT